MAQKTPKFTVKICMGTTCFVMGASNLQELIELIPDKYEGEVEVLGVPCLGLCSEESQYSSAPYVNVGGEVVQSATVENVLETIERKLKNE